MLGKISTRTFDIDVIQHRKTGLLVAQCDDLKGLTVFGRSIDELERKVEPAVRELLEAQGIRVLSVEMHDSEDVPAAFLHAFIASAKMEFEPA